MKESSEMILQNASMKKLFLNLCIPTIVVMIVVVLYNMTDIFFIGKTGDLDQVAAISLSGPYFSALQGLGTLLGGGGCILISMLLGRKEEKQLKNVTSFCCYASLLLGIVFATVTLLFMEPVMTVLGAAGQTRAYAVRYIRILGLGAPAILFAGVFANIIRADGSALQSMIANGAGTLTNILLDPVLILGLRMGIEGAAIATVAGNLVSCIYLAWYIGTRQKHFSLHVKDLSLSRTVWQAPILGAPQAISTILMSFSHVFANRLLLTYGDIAVAASGIASKAGMLIVMIIMGICMGLQPAISYNYAAGNKGRLRKIILTFLSVTTIFSCLAAGLIILRRDPVIRIFMKEEALSEYGRMMLTGSLAGAPVYGIIQLSTAFLQAAGKPACATVLSLLQKAVVYVPALYLMNLCFGLGGLSFAPSVTDIIVSIAGALFAVQCYRSAPGSPEFTPEPV